MYHHDNCISVGERLALNRCIKKGVVPSVLFFVTLSVKSEEKKAHRQRRVSSVSFRFISRVVPTVCLLATSHTRFGVDEAGFCTFCFVIVC